MAINIHVEHVSKQYRIGMINSGMLFRDVQSWLARRLGKPDPHAKIGREFPSGSGDRFWALSDVSLDVEQGDRIGIIGKNGAGKSTLLKILSRITAPTEGRVLIKGRVASLLEVGTGFHPELTGRENIYLNGAILGMNKRAIRAKMEEIVDFSEVSQFIDTPVKRYSSGMYVRLAFSVAAHLENEILLADEVLAVGDAAFQRKCIGKMEEVSKGSGKTILYVSHQMNTIRQLCRKSMLLDNGRVVDYSDTDSVVSRYLQSSRDGAEGGRHEFADAGGELYVERIDFADSDGTIDSSFEARDGVSIRMTCHVRKALRGVYSYFEIRNSDGIPVIISDSTEGGEHIFDDAGVGKNEIVIRVPAFSLGTGLYYFYMNITAQSDTSQSLFQTGRTLTFRVKDSFSRRGETRNAVTSIIPRWERRGAE
jgi:lipopolysaccharide transport system ATP-binding protein